MNKNNEKYIYRLVLQIWVAYFLYGSIVLLVTGYLLKTQLLEKIPNGDLSFLEIIFNIVVSLLFFLCAVYFFVYPFYVKLIINNDGFVYKTIYMTLEAKWMNCELLDNHPFFFGKFGLLVPISRRTTFNKLAEFLVDINSVGSIAVNYYGILFAPQKLKEEIRDHAPFLFGVLYSSLDFLKTLNALDTLVDQYINSQIHRDIFFRLFEKHYSRYILNGEKFVKDYFNMISNHRDRTSILVAIWNEVIQDYFEKTERLIQVSDDDFKNKIKEIKGRYLER